jgi:hypothetical protein
VKKVATKSVFCVLKLFSTFDKIVINSLIHWNDNYSDLEVDFGSEDNASIVYATLMVDKEVSV